MKPLVSVALALILLLSLTAPTLADPPKHDSFSFTGEPYMRVSCGDFEIWHTFTADVQRTMFYDQNGTLVREVWHQTGVDIFYNYTTGKSVEGKYTLKEQIDPSTGVETYTGTPYHIVLPGYGPVQFMAGRWIATANEEEWLFTKGKLVLVDFDQTLLCSLLR